MGMPQQLIARIEHVDLATTDELARKALAAGFDGLMVVSPRDDEERAAISACVALRNSFPRTWLAADFGAMPPVRAAEQAWSLQLDGVLFSNLGVDSMEEGPDAQALLSQCAVARRQGCTLMVAADDEEDCEMIGRRFWSFGFALAVHGQRLPEHVEELARENDEPLVLVTTRNDLPDVSASSVVMKIGVDDALEALKGTVAMWRETRTSVVGPD